MSKYKFKPNERYAVWITHGEKCYLCTRPLDLKTSEVDHVIPESLLKAPEELKRVLHNLGRPNDFDVNSYANWLPTCKPCNGRKNDIVFDPAPIIQIQLQKAAEKAQEAANIAAEMVSARKIANAVNALECASETGDLDEETINSIATIILKHRRPELVGEPIHFTPSNVFRAERNGEQVTITSCRNGLLKKIEITNKATGVITTGASLIGDNTNEIEYDSVTGVFSSKPKGL